MVGSVVSDDGNPPFISGVINLDEILRPDFLGRGEGEVGGGGGGRGVLTIIR